MIMVALSSGKTVLRDAISVEAAWLRCTVSWSVWTAATLGTAAISKQASKQTSQQNLYICLNSFSRSLKSRLHCSISLKTIRWQHPDSCVTNMGAADVPSKEPAEPYMTCVLSASLNDIFLKQVNRTRTNCSRSTSRKVLWNINTKLRPTYLCGYRKSWISFSYCLGSMGCLTSGCSLMTGNCSS